MQLFLFGRWEQTATQTRSANLRWRGGTGTTHQPTKNLRGWEEGTAGVATQGNCSGVCVTLCSSSRHKQVGGGPTKKVQLGVMPHLRSFNSSYSIHCDAREVVLATTTYLRSTSIFSILARSTQTQLSSRHPHTPSCASRRAPCQGVSSRR